MEEGRHIPRQTKKSAARELPLPSFFTDPRFVVFMVFTLVFFLLFALIILTFEPKKPVTSIPGVITAPAAPPATLPTEPPVTQVQQDIPASTTPPVRQIRLI